MCEFKAFLKKDEQEEMVAEDIVYAKSDNNLIILRDVLGRQVKVDNVGILEVDVEAERLVLKPHSYKKS